jgi:signal transduction histidine kinase/CheY-like chemotaxis protein
MSLRLALIGLTVVLTAVAAIGVARLYSARQRYEDKLVSASSLATAAANLASAGLTEEEVLRDAHGAAAAGERATAAADYNAAAETAQALAAGDAQSTRLLAAQVAAEDQLRSLAGQGHLAQATALTGPIAQARALATQLQVRQRARQRTARNTARSDSRQALALVIVAGLLALIGALALITLLVGTMRRPLAALVAATRELAAGNLERRVEPAGPRELQDLGAAFNAMAEDLAMAQRRIESDRRRLEITIESLGDALIVTEADGSSIAAVNPRASDLVPELVASGRTDARDSALPELGEALEHETLIEHGGRTLAVTAAMLGAGTDTAATDGVVWTVRDMSERARLEKAKSEFVATASHELRSPLTSIKGFVELLARSSADMAPKQREFIDIILRSTDRLVDLVNDLLDVARIEADRVEINRRPTDIGEEVKEVAELMGPRIAHKGQMLALHVDPALPPALADASRVRQIVANLLTNAHMYTPPGGRLEVSVESEPRFVQIRVSDSGGGMSPVECERVFERFFRGRDGTSTSPGTGLGLSIVKSLVDLHEGQIDVDSEIGVGTTFRVRLPIVTGGADATSASQAIRGRRVLVVDDEPAIAELIAGQLAPFDVHTTIAGSGAEALQRLHEDSYEAVTLDILMPGMDGFEVLRQIRADPQLRTLPIVFVSVFSERQELSGEWVVAKPIDADELRDVLGAAVSAGRSRLLVVARDELRDALEPNLGELGIDRQWVTNGTAAARICGEQRFEIALVDVGIRNPRAVLQGLNLRGRRIRRAVILFTDGHSPMPEGVDHFGMDVVPVQEAARAVVAAIRPAPGG